MTDPGTFLLAALALLAVPGPTNTLLATSGAAVGFRRSLFLIPAEMTGYAASVAVLALAIGPLVRQWPLLGVGLRVACGLYLVSVACRLWRDGGLTGEAVRPVRFTQVLTTTLLNPKGVVFAFGILPYLAEGEVSRSLPYCGALLATIAAVATGWITLGSLTKAGLGRRHDVRLVRRCGAAAMFLFAVIISGSAIAQ